MRREAAGVKLFKWYSGLAPLRRAEFHIPGGGNGKTKHFITSDLGPGIKMIIYFILVQAVTTAE